MKRADAKDQVRVLKYVLTCMCYASKYPDALPMKRADAKDQVRVQVCVNLHVLCIKIPGCYPHEEGRCQGPGQGSSMC